MHFMQVILCKLHRLFTIINSQPAPNQHRFESPKLPILDTKTPFWLIRAIPEYASSWFLLPLDPFSICVTLAWDSWLVTAVSVHLTICARTPYCNVYVLNQLRTYVTNGLVYITLSVIKIRSLVRAFDTVSKMLQQHYCIWAVCIDDSVPLEDRPLSISTLAKGV